MRLQYNKDEYNESTSRTTFETSLLVDPRLGSRGPLDDSLREPQSDLLVGGLGRVGSVADVAANVDTEIASDGARGGFAGLSGSQQLSALRAGVLALPNHGEHGGSLHELNQTTEERLGGKIGVVSLEVGLRRLHKLHSDQLVSLLLESSNDGAAQVALNAVGLDHDEGSLSLLDHLDSRLTLRQDDR